MLQKGTSVGCGVVSWSTTVSASVVFQSLHVPQVIESKKRTTNDLVPCLQVPSDTNALNLRAENSLLQSREEP